MVGFRLKAELQTAANPASPEAGYKKSRMAARTVSSYHRTEFSDDLAQALSENGVPIGPGMAYIGAASVLIQRTLDEIIAPGYKQSDFASCVRSWPIISTWESVKAVTDKHLQRARGEQGPLVPKRRKLFRRN